MMRIAIAGAGGFAQILIEQISQSAHGLLVLSRSERPELAAAFECQVAVVDYENVEDLRFMLQGTDLVISTISGTSQINLIDAAKRARVSCFVPSEFEGSLSHRPAHDPLDQGSSTALDWLRNFSSAKPHPLKFAVFSCGVFYERLAPGGLAAYNLGASTNCQQQGEYLVDFGQLTAEIPETNPQGRSVQLVMTSVFDVARFVAAAIELGIDSWPREFKMRGTQLSTRALANMCSEVVGAPLNITRRPYAELHDWLQFYEESQDWPKWYQMQQLIQTANGRYQFSDHNLNDLVDVQPVGLRTWLASVWQAQG